MWQTRNRQRTGRVQEMRSTGYAKWQGTPTKCDKAGSSNLGRFRRPNLKPTLQTPNFRTFKLANFRTLNLSKFQTRNCRNRQTFELTKKHSFKLSKFESRSKLTAQQSEGLSLKQLVELESSSKPWKFESFNHSSWKSSNFDARPLAQQGAQALQLQRPWNLRSSKSQAFKLSNLRVRATSLGTPFGVLGVLSWTGVRTSVLWPPEVSNPNMNCKPGPIKAAKTISEMETTHRPQSSSFWGFIFRIL